MTTLELYHSVLRRLIAAGIQEPEAEASLLVSHLLRCGRAAIFLNGAHPVAASVVAAADKAIERRSAREPLAYILGEQEFYGRTFVVTPDVLIPRPETELLVERAVRALVPQQGTARPRILDLGVGSGVIAITLALEIPHALVVGLDLSLAALQVARSNACRLGAEQVNWLNSDWGLALREGCAFDLVVANPPYVAQQLAAELQPELAAEPALALYGGQDGRRDIARIMGDVARLLVPGGRLLMEIGFDQHAYVISEMQALGRFDQVEVHVDYAGLPRILDARRTR